jgi:hypothetical protein
MKALKLAAWALFAFAVTELPAQAAWNNVFQPTCFGRLNRSTSNYYCQSCAPVVAHYAPLPVCNTCQAPPPPQCATTTVMRPYVESVVNYESRYEDVPVTTYQKSYYQEAVTTMHTSLYPDPCNCGGYVARSAPVTTWQLKEQLCPVQSWVKRCTQVPVTSYRIAYKAEQQTTCSAPAPSCPTCTPAPPSTPSNSYSSPPPPTVEPRPGPVGPNVPSSYYPMTTNQTKASSGWQPAVSPAAPAADVVQGQVVRNDRTPTPQTQVLFVNAANGARHSATTNDAGRFSLALGAGQYHVFFANGSGSAAYHSQINVESRHANTINLINN